MKSFTSKLFSILLAGLLLVTLIACGNDPAFVPPASTDTANQPDETETSVPADSGLDISEEVTLTIYFIGDEKADFKRIWKEVEVYTKDIINAKYDCYFVPFGDYSSKMSVLSASGGSYDMAFDADWMNYPNLSKKGAYMDLAELLPKYAPQYWENIKAIGADKAIADKGAVYGLPWIVPKNSHPYIMVNIGQSGIGEAGFSLASNSVRTIEELDAMFMEIIKYPTTKKSYFTPGLVTTGESIPEYTAMRDNLYTGWHNLFCLTYDITQDKVTLIPVEETAAFRDAVGYATKWAEAGVIPSDYLVNLDAYVSVPDTEKTVGTSFLGHKYQVLGSYPDDFVFSEMYPDSKWPQSSPLNNMMVISADSKYPERCLRFIEEISVNKEFNLLVCFGVEGDTYQYDENGYITLPDGQDLSNSTYFDWPGQWGLWREDLMPLTVSQPQAFFDENAKVIASATNYVSPLAGFVPDIEPIKNEIAMRTTLLEEVVKPLGCGLYPGGVDAIDALIDRMHNEAGTDIILQELQRQVDEYLGQ